jgi:hypothetical protein
MFWDVVLVLVLLMIHGLAWDPHRSAIHPVPPVEERGLGASTMGQTATAGITAVSILIPASLLVLQFSRDGTGALPTVAGKNAFRGILWLTLSLIAGVVVLWLIPIRAAVVDVSRVYEVGILFSAQPVVLLVGVLRIVLGLEVAVSGRGA